MVGGRGLGGAAAAASVGTYFNDRGRTNNQASAAAAAVVEISFPRGLLCVSSAHTHSPHTYSTHTFAGWMPPLERRDSCSPRTKRFCVAAALPPFAICRPPLRNHPSPSPTPSHCKQRRASPVTSLLLLLLLLPGPVTGWRHRASAATQNSKPGEEVEPTAQFKGQQYPPAPLVPLTGTNVSSDGGSRKIS